MEQIENLIELRKAANKYLQARNEFIEVAKKNKELWGNDNIIGRIGEFVVLQYLRELDIKTENRENQSQKGWDFKCQRTDENGINKEFLVSVKTITHENNKGNTSHVTYPIKKGNGEVEMSIPWNELIVVVLEEDNNKKVFVEKIGIITKEELEDQNKQRKIEGKNQISYITRKMLDDVNIFKKVIKDRNELNYL